MNLTLEELAMVDATKLLTALNDNRNSGFVVRIATDMLCNDRSNADVAFDWLAVLMLGERLAELGLEPEWSTVGSRDHILAVDFSINGVLNQSALDALTAYAASYLTFYTDGHFPTVTDETSVFDYEQTLLSFEDDIKNRVHRFDDIAKLYTSSFVAGLRENYLGADYVTMIGRHQLRLKKWLDVSALRCSA